MAETVLDRVQNDTLPSYDGELEGQDITGYTIKLNMRKPDGTSNTKTATFTDASKGQFTFDFVATDFDLVGDYDAQIEVTDGGGDKETFSSIVIQVEAEIPEGP